MEGIFEQELHRICHLEASAICKERRESVLSALKTEVVSSDERKSAYSKLLSDLDNWLTQYYSDLVFELKRATARNMIASSICELKKITPEP